jgi:hypothetical protein
VAAVARVMGTNLLVLVEVALLLLDIVVHKLRQVAQSQKAAATLIMYLHLLVRLLLGYRINNVTFCKN